jgi:hypothetical protein
MKGTHMATITADDIRVLAQSNADDPVLLLSNGDVFVVPRAEATTGTVIYTKAALVEEFGNEVTDVQAEVLAAGLTAQLR